MSTSYKFLDNSAVYFTSSTVAGWTYVFTREMYNQRLNYLQCSLVIASYVTEPWYWLYSSAIDYFKDNNGLHDFAILDGF